MKEDGTASSYVSRKNLAHCDIPDKRICMLRDSWEHQFWIDSMLDQYVILFLFVSSLKNESAIGQAFRYMIHMSLMIHDSHSCDTYLQRIQCQMLSVSEQNETFDLSLTDSLSVTE